MASALGSRALFGSERRFANTSVGAPRNMSRQLRR
jgi:hypothetical protein